MSAYLEKLAEYHRGKGNAPRAGLYLALVAEERANGTPESLTDGIPTVNKETYKRILEAVGATGYRFVTAIRPVSIENLLIEDGQREPRRLGFVNDSITMRTAVFPEMKVVINPNNFRIEGSNNLSTDEQKNRIEEEEARWKNQLPEDIRPFVSMRMVGSINTLSIRRCLHG